MATFEAFGMYSYELCKEHAVMYVKQSRIAVEIKPLKGGRVKTKKAVKAKVEDVQLKLAKLLHESGRKPVELRKIYRSDLPVMPFAEWEALDAATVEGRLMMAAFLLDKRRRKTLQGIFSSR